MEKNDKIKLFNQTATTLVYLASSEYSKELLRSNYKPGDTVYIHVTRDTGFIVAYNNNDIKKLVPIEMKEHEYILNFCRDIR